MPLETKAAFARRLNWNRSTVTRAAQAGRLVLVGNLVDVEPSLARLKATEGGLWGWITIMRNDVSKGFTITPDKKFGLTVKDLCRPGTVVTFKPNQKKPEYDDLVALYQGKELFRYRRF